MPRPSIVLAVVCTASLLACKPEAPPEPPKVTTVACGVEAFERVWTAERRASLDEALSGVPGEWPRQALATIDERVTTQREPWLSTYAQACEAQDQPAQRCLDHQLWQLDAITIVLGEHPDRASALWAEIDNLLIDPAACLGSQEPSFDAPQLSREAGRGLAKMRLLLNLGGGTAGDATTPELAELLRTLELDPLVRDTPAYAMPVHATKAVAAFHAGRIDEADAALRAATEAGTSLGARAQMSLGHIRALLAFYRGDAEGGLLALDEGLAAAREQPDPWLLFASLRNAGRVRIELGEHEGAIAPLTEAIALSTRLAGLENPHTAELQLSLARAQLALGRIEAAHDLLTQARDSFVNTLGPDHPQTLVSVLATGQLLLQAGQPIEANHAFLDLLEIYGELYGPKDVRTSTVKLELGDTLIAMEQYDGARLMYMEALTPLVQALGTEHRDVIRTVVHLGFAEAKLGHHDEAETHCRRAVELVKVLAAADPLIDEAKRCLESVGSAGNGAPRRSR